MRFCVEASSLDLIHLDLQFLHRRSGTGIYSSVDLLDRLECDSCVSCQNPCIFFFIPSVNVGYDNMIKFSFLFPVCCVCPIIG